MHARVSTITGSPEQAEAGISDFQEKVVPWIKENGGRGGILFVDRETGKAVAVTLWNDEEAMRQSEEAANEHRRRVSDEMESAASPTVERYEVAVFDA
jgi:heme-degrading monooxygenase HmoA